MKSIIPTVDFNNTGSEEQVVTGFKNQGVCVIKNVFSQSECDHYMGQIVSNISNIAPNSRIAGYYQNNQPVPLYQIQSDSVSKSKFNTIHDPPFTRPGLIQALFANLSAVWDVRTHDRVEQVFDLLYKNLRDDYQNKLFVSGDGININPPVNIINADQDWSHVDLTTDQPWKCVQGQVVLTKTSAGFRCTPESQ